MNVLKEKKVSPKKTEIFCCYAHEDQPLLSKLRTHLASLEREDLISIWHDADISPGTEWEEEINKHLDTADIILLLVSPDFIASEYCYSKEMKRAMERHEQKMACVVPIILRPVSWQEAPFAKLQALPTTAKPVTEWRNRDKAFDSVIKGIRAIIKEVKNTVIDIPRSSLPSIWNVPYPRNPLFTGREDLLARLATILKTNHAPALTKPLAIKGMGGIGKTQLAIEFVYRNHQDYQAILWINADTRETFASDCVAITELLGLRGESTRDQALAILPVKEWLRAHTQWLLILDNADDLTFIHTFIAQTFKGHILLTTRMQAVSKIAQPLEVETWNPETGTLFLLRRMGLLAPDASLQQASRVNRATAREIAMQVGGLPLALDQAGAYLEETGCNLTDYLRLYQECRMQLLQRRGKLAEDHPDSVLTTFSLLFQRLDETEHMAAEVLQLCAFLQPDAIPEALVIKGIIKKAKVFNVIGGTSLEPVTSEWLVLDQAIAALRRFSLIKRDSEHRRALSIHRVVQAVLRDTMDKETYRHWLRRTVRALVEIYRFMFRELRQEFVSVEGYLEPIFSHAYECAVLLIQRNDAACYGAWVCRTSLGYIYEKQGRFEELEPLLQRSLALHEQHLGAVHSSTIDCLNQLAGFYERWGKHAKKEPFLQRLLTIEEHRYGAEDFSTIMSGESLAKCYCKQGKYTEAEPLLQRVLAYWERQNTELASVNLCIADALYDLTKCCFEQGKYTEAASLGQRAIVIYEQQGRSESCEYLRRMIQKG